MNDERPIGPNPCYECGGEYGEHTKDCSVSTPSGGELQTCPFCGQAPQLMTNWTGPRFVRCRNCNIGWFEDKDWNRRAPAPDLEAIAEETANLISSRWRSGAFRKDGGVSPGMKQIILSALQRVQSGYIVKDPSK